MEKLVGFGADLNLADADGDTALHLAMVRETIATITSDTPETSRVRILLSRNLHIVTITWPPFRLNLDLEILPHSHIGPQAVCSCYSTLMYTMYDMCLYVYLVMLYIACLPYCLLTFAMGQ